MVEVEVNGSKVSVAPGSMVMTALEQLGLYVPHFCYHKHLSIAANCRMCLVEVEKAPKPLPACATPVMPGMVVRTASAKAKQAQNAVMEFLLINHPLDCPICDQGGECQLQDLAVGYGASKSSYGEAKRVVFHKQLGPLIAAQEMSRCIHCTRCVRFGQELAGQMELGMANRGEHSEIMSFLGESVDSEVSGNMIDLCPVGALTSKPFRYSARTWELSRRKTISPHDALGTNMVAQVKNNQVLRVVPQENTAINDCWLADRDRFSYEALLHGERLANPRIKRDGTWHDVSWQEALELLTTKLRAATVQPGGIAGLVTPHATAEELFLFDRLFATLKQPYCAQPRQADSTWAQARQGAPWLGLPLVELNNLRQVLVVGSFLRKDHPLLTLRLRTAKQLTLHSLHALQQDWAMPSGKLGVSLVRAPSQWATALAEMAVACGATLPPVLAQAFANVTPSNEARRIAQALMQDGQDSSPSQSASQNPSGKAILLGNAVTHGQHTTLITALVQAIAERTGARFGFLTEAANSVGAHLLASKALPFAQVAQHGAQVTLLFNCEPQLDSHHAAAAQRMLANSQFVVACTTFRDEQLDALAHVQLPLAPFSETAGTYINAEGRIQSFQAVTEPNLQARPGWKILRVLGNLLDLPGFEYDTAAQVWQATGLSQEGLAAQLDNRVDASKLTAPPAATAGEQIERVADVPIYASDALVRRAPSLQRTRDACPPVASLPATLWRKLGLDGMAHAQVRLTQGAVSAAVPSQFVVLEARLDQTLADNTVRVPAAHALTAALGEMYGAIHVEKATA